MHKNRNILFISILIVVIVLFCSCSNIFGPSKNTKEEFERLQKDSMNPELFDFTISMSSRNQMAGGEKQPIDVIRIRSLQSGFPDDFSLKVNNETIIFYYETLSHRNGIYLFNYGELYDIEVVSNQDTTRVKFRIPYKVEIRNTSHESYYYYKDYFLRWHVAKNNQYQSVSLSSLVRYYEFFIPTSRRLYIFPANMIRRDMNDDNFDYIISIGVLNVNYAREKRINIFGYESDGILLYCPIKHTGNF